MSTKISYNEYKNASVTDLLAKLGLNMAETTEDTYIYLVEDDDGDVYLDYCEKKDRHSYVADEMEGYYVSAHDEWFLSQVVTPAEIEDELGLGKGTVRQYLFNHGDEMIKKGEARKADGRTWLLLRSAAYRIWADRVRQL